MKGFARLMSVSALAVVCGTAAQAITLTDNGWSIDLVGSGANAGTVENWRRGQGPDHLAQQSYHYRLAGGDFEEYVGTLGTAVVTQALPNMVNFRWVQNTWSLDITYFLTGGQQQSDLAEIVRIENRGSSALNMSLFEYDDFDLNGSAGGDTATRLNSSTMFQSDGPWNVTVGATPIPSLSQIAGFPSIINELTDLNVDNLDPTLQSFFGDATFAFQWDISVGANSTWMMSKNKILAVPEPGTMIALGAGLAAIVARRRRK